MTKRKSGTVRFRFSDGTIEEVDLVDVLAKNAHDLKRLREAEAADQRERHVGGALASAEARVERNRANVKAIAEELIAKNEPRGNWVKRISVALAEKGEPLGDAAVRGHLDYLGYPSSKKKRRLAR